MPTDTDHIRSLPYSQPGTQPHDPQLLTIGQFVSSFSAQHGIPRLLSVDNPHRTAPECVISPHQKYFRRHAIANPINSVELYKNMNQNVENWNFAKSKATIVRILYKKQ